MENGIEDLSCPESHVNDPTSRSKSVRADNVNRDQPDQLEGSSQRKSMTFIEDIAEGRAEDKEITSPSSDKQTNGDPTHFSAISEDYATVEKSTSSCKSDFTSDKLKVGCENNFEAENGVTCESNSVSETSSVARDGDSHGPEAASPDGIVGILHTHEDGARTKSGEEGLPGKPEKQVTFAEEVAIVEPDEFIKQPEEASGELEQSSSRSPVGFSHVAVADGHQAGSGLADIDVHGDGLKPADDGIVDAGVNVAGCVDSSQQTASGCGHDPTECQAATDSVDASPAVVKDEAKGVVEEDTERDDDSSEATALLAKESGCPSKEAGLEAGRMKLQDFLKNYDLSSEPSWADSSDHCHHDFHDGDTRDLENADDDSPDEELRHLLGPDVDRGWAWVVLVLNYLGMTIFGTFAFSAGIFQVEILSSIEPDIQKAAWVGATHLCLVSLSGPFASLVRDFLGSRKTILIASVVICVGMIGASFSKTVTHLIITYGLITGLGMGMALNPMFVSAGYYFVRYRGVASGVVAAGSSTGMFIGGPIVQTLLDNYGLAGAYLIMGAVGLQLAVVGMVMRPSSMERTPQQGRQMVLEKNWKMESIMLASASTLPSVGGLGSVLGASSFNVLRDKDTQSDTQKSQLLYGIPEGKVVDHLVQEVVVTSVDTQDTHSRLGLQPRQRLYSQCSTLGSVENMSTRGRLYSSYILKEIGHPLSGSSLSIRTYDKPRGTVTCCQFTCSSFDAFRILRNPAFLLYMFSTFMWYFGETAVFTYLPSYASSEGTPAIKSALLMTVMGAGSIVSRLVTGFVAGDSSVGPELMHVGLLGLCGALTITFPVYASSTVGQFMYSGLFGLYAGGLVSSINILVIQLIGVENIALGFGLISFSLGVGSLVGPVLAGVIVGQTGNYGHVYYFCGSLLLVGCLSGCPIVMFKPRHPEPDSLGYFRKRESIRSGSQVVSVDDGVRSVV